MKKNIYIIPGLGESCDLVRYQTLGKALQGIGYKVNYVNPNWYRPLSEQVFPVGKDDVVFGFSFGAVIAYLIAEKYKFKKVIFGSISPIHTFSFKSLVDDYKEHMSVELAIEISKDVKSIEVSLDKLTTPFVRLAGDKEKMEADILVPNTKHYITKNYINSIVKILS